jgi:hypothetical protein
LSGFDYAATHEIYSPLVCFRGLHRCVDNPGGQYIPWALFLFPVWVLLVTLNILAEEFRRPIEKAETHTAPMQ